MFHNVHGREAFPAIEWLLNFVGFFVASYIAGGGVGALIVAFQNRKRRRRFSHSLFRLSAVSLAAALAGLSLWTIATKLFFAPSSNASNYVCFAPALILAVLMLVNFLFTGFTSRWTEDEDREWWGRSAAWILITIVGWISINLIVLWGAQAISGSPTGNALDVFLGKGGVQTGTTAKALLGSFGGVTGIAGALLALRSRISNLFGQRAALQSVLIAVAIIFFVLLSIIISWA